MDGYSRKDGTSAARSRRVAAEFAAFTFGVAGLFIFLHSASAETVPTVTIGKAVDTIPFTVVEVAIERDFFKNNGVNVKQVLVQGSSAANAAMIGGSLQFACEAAVPLMLARSHGVPIMAVDALDSGVTLQFIAAKKWLAKHPLPPNADLKQKMTALNGSVLGAVGTTDPAFYGLVRGWADLPKREGYRTETLTSQAAVAIAMQRGLIDVSVQSPPHSEELVALGDGVLFVDRKDVARFNNVAYDILTTTTDYAQKNPDVVKKVATSIAQALDFMRSHPDETLAIEQKHFPKLDKAVLQKSLQDIPFAQHGLQSQEAWDSAVKLGNETGFLKGVTAAPGGDFWTNKYIDRSKLTN